MDDFCSLLDSVAKYRQTVMEYRIARTKAEEAIRVYQMALQAMEDALNEHLKTIDVDADDPAMKAGQLTLD